MDKKPYVVNVHFEGSVNLFVDAVDEVQAEDLANERFRDMSAEEIVGFCKENLDIECEVGKLNVLL